MKPILRQKDVDFMLDVAAKHSILLISFFLNHFTASSKRIDPIPFF